MKDYSNCRTMTMKCNGVDTKSGMMEYFLVVQKRKRELMHVLHVFLYMYQIYIQICSSMISPLY